MALDIIETECQQFHVNGQVYLVTEQDVRDLKRQLLDLEKKFAAEKEARFLARNLQLPGV